MTTKKRKSLNITFVNLNQSKPKTCGSCKHAQNDLGMFALHCDMWIEHKKLPPNICKDDSKVRSWEKACKYYDNQFTTKK